MKIWGILVHLGRNMWADKKAQTELHFDEELWNKIVCKCAENGLNTIIMDVGEGAVYPSHPELAIEGSWTPEKIKSEVLRLREMGIELVPKLNFSAHHDAWLGEYGRMVSTSIYYKVCKELIEDVYEMFLHPSFIHIGMDEEDKSHMSAFNQSFYMTIMRHDELLVHDINYFVKCVEALGAKCHMWHDPMCSISPEHAQNISKSVIPEVWMYYSYLKENWQKVSDEPEYVQKYYKEHFVKMYGHEIEYIEEDPFVVQTKALLDKFIAEKRPYICTSSNYQVKHNDRDTIRYIMQEDPNFEGFQGMINAPWGMVMPEFEARLTEAIDLLAEAKRIAGM